MNPGRILIVTMAVLLVVMSICPAIAMTKVHKTKAESHCGSENPATPQDMPKLQCCCNQDAISVQAVHAPKDDTIQQIVPSTQVEGIHPVFLSDRDHFPFQKTRDHLSILSILRL